MSRSYKGVTSLLGVLAFAGCAEQGGPRAGALGAAGGLGESMPAVGPQLTRYVALGDSFVSGDGNYDYAWGDSCRRSPRSWPKLLSEQLAEQGAAPAFVLAGCSGAVIDVVRASQVPRIAPADALTLVTVTVGGNDLEISKEMGNCLLSSSSCATREGDLTARIEQTAPRLQALYEEVKRAANGGTVVATGYPLLVTADAHTRTGCKGLLDADEVSMIRRLIQLMNAKIRAAAEQAQIPSVTSELEQAFAGHEACAPEANHNRWINGGSLSDLKNSLLHPNLDGNKAFASTVRGALQRVLSVSHVADTASDPVAPDQTTSDPLGVELPDGSLAPDNQADAGLGELSEDAPSSGDDPPLGGLDPSDELPPAEGPSEPTEVGPDDESTDDGEIGTGAAFDEGEQPGLDSDAYGSLEEDDP